MDMPEIPAAEMPDMPVAQSGPDVGFLAKIKSTLSLDNISQKLHLSKDKLIELGLYLGIGFISGYLIKKYSQYVVSLVVLIIGLVVLQQLDLLMITVNADKVRSLLGIYPPTTVDASLLTTYWEWVRLNFSIVLSFSIGFLCGLKVG